MHLARIRRFQTVETMRFLLLLYITFVFHYTSRIKLCQLLYYYYYTIFTYQKRLKKLMTRVKGANRPTIALLTFKVFLQTLAVRNSIEILGLVEYFT